MTRRAVAFGRSAFVTALLPYCLLQSALLGCGGVGVDVAGAGSAVDAGPDRTVNVGDVVVLMGTSTGVATHKWELMSRPAGSAAVVLNERSLTNASFIADREGDYVATLIGAVSNNPTAPDVNPADTDDVTITAVGNGGTGGTGGEGGMSADVHADEVDDSLTDINDAGCLGSCIGDPANTTGPPDFVAGQGGTTASLGPNGTLGLVFVDELCVVDGDTSTPDIIVYEVGGVQVEDFSVDAAVEGGLLTGNPVRSIVATDQPERRLDLTAVIGGAGLVERIQIIDIDGPPDEPEEPGFEQGWGADIDAVACFSR